MADAPKAVDSSRTIIQALETQYHSITDLYSRMADEVKGEKRGFTKDLFIAPEAMAETAKVYNTCITDVKTLEAPYTPYCAAHRAEIVKLEILARSLVLAYHLGECESDVEDVGPKTTWSHMDIAVPIGVKMMDEAANEVFAHGKSTLSDFLAALPRKKLPGHTSYTDLAVESLWGDLASAMTPGSSIESKKQCKALQ